MIRFVLLLFFTLHVSRGFKSEENNNLDPRDAAKEALRSKSLSGLMTLWDGIHKNIDLFTGEVETRPHNEPVPEEMCHLRCCGNNSLPHVFEAKDGMSARGGLVGICGPTFFVCLWALYIFMYFTN